ncbi:MAG: hypothetical protein ACPIOQ_85805, partial [Promethearchaeia archaeon]
MMFAHGALDAKFAGIAAQVQDRARPACQAGAHSGGGDGGDAAPVAAPVVVGALAVLVVPELCGNRWVVPAALYSAL